MAVSIVINSQSISVTVERNNRIFYSQTIDLDPGLIKDGYVVDRKTVATKIDTLFKSDRLPRSPVYATISGMPYIYRILALPRMNLAMLPEAIERATQKEIHLPLSDLYLDWQIIEQSENEITVYVLGVPRRLIDALYETLTTAGIHLAAVGLKPLALARSANRFNAVIVDFEPDWFDIIIVSEGLPVTLHTVAPRSSLADFEDNVAHLADELSRTIEFFNLTHKENGITPDAPVLFTGSLAIEPAAEDLLVKYITNPIQSMVSSMKTTPDFPVGKYAANLGLLLKSKGKMNVSVQAKEQYININLDLLAGRRRALSHPVTIQQILVPAALVLAVLLIIPLLMQNHQATAATSELQSRLDEANRNLRLNRMILDQAYSLENSIQGLNDEMQAIEKEREQIVGQGELANLLTVILENLPVNTHTTSLVADSRQLDVEGLAPSSDAVFSYAKALKNQGVFLEVRVTLLDDSGLTDNPVSDKPAVKFEIALVR